MLPIAVALLLCMLMFVSSVSAIGKPKDVLRWDDAYFATIGEPETVDPAWGYDTASAQLIMNVLDSLIFWHREEAPGYPGGFEPRLATSWWVSPGGLTYNFTLRTDAKWHDLDTYGYVTARDVEYSIERMMTLDHVGGPAWMLYYPLTGLYSSAEIDLENEIQVNALGVLIDDSVTSDHVTNTVQFNLLTPRVGWMQILAQTFGAVYSRDWANWLKAQGRSVWSGDWSEVLAEYKDGTATGWTMDHTGWLAFCDRYVGYTASPFQMDKDGNFAPELMGSGPYKFKLWEVTNRWVVEKFDDYYLGWPAPTAWEVLAASPSDMPTNITYGPVTVRQADYVSRVNHYLVESWPARKLMFLSPTKESMADLAGVPRDYMDDVQGQPHIRGTKNLPVLSVVATYYNYDVSVTSALVSSKPALKTAGGWVDPKYDLFGDIHLRKGFGYAFDYAKFISDRYKGEGEVPGTPHKYWLNYYNASKPKMQQDLDKARYHLKMAWGGSDPNDDGVVEPGDEGDLWTYGFKCELQYNSGNTMRQAFCEMLKTILLTNVGFPDTTDITINTNGYPWGTGYIPAKNQYELQVYVTGWTADFADADNFVFTFMHSKGNSAGFQRIKWGQGWSTDGHNEFHPTSGRLLPYTNWEGNTVTEINATYVDYAVKEAANPANPRGEIYNELADIWWGELPTMTPVQPLGRHWERDCVQGWYHNPILGGSLLHQIGSTPVFYFYHLWKGLDADMSLSDYHSGLDREPYDYGYIDSSEVSVINAHYYDKFEIGGVWYTIEGSLSYNRVADVTYEGRDLATQTMEMDGVNYLKGVLPQAVAIIPSGSDGLVNIWDIGLVYATWHDYVAPDPSPPWLMR